jgi:putative hydrolase
MGHQYRVLTDHSLPPDQVPEQLVRLAALPRGLTRFRSLSGIEVDLLDDGSRDEDDNLWGSLDVVVASVHSELRMGRLATTQRMVTAVQNPHTCGCRRRLVGDR